MEIEFNNTIINFSTNELLKQQFYTNKGLAFEKVIKETCQTYNNNFYYFFIGYLFIGSVLPFILFFILKRFNIPFDIYAIIKETSDNIFLVYSIFLLLLLLIQDGIIPI